MRTAAKPIVAVDVDGILRKASAAVARGPSLADAPILALASSRTSGELRCRYRHWPAVWEGMPPTLPADAPEAARVLALVLELGELEIQLFLLQKAPAAEPAVVQRYRDRIVSKLGETREDPNAAAVEQEAVARASSDRADAVRIMRTRIAEWQKQLDDALRLAWIAARRSNGR